MTDKLIDEYKGNSICEKRCVILVKEQYGILIPGYASCKMNNDIITLTSKAGSIEYLKSWSFYIP